MGLGTEATAMADTTDLMAGMMVGEYRILGPLGAGGMGRVYSAEHPVIAKKAAIKVLHPELSVNKEAVERFVQEARSVNQIGHPNIVDIFAFGALPDGRNYFVMEWLRGESLRDRMQRKPLSVADALAVLETITLPLEAAHEQGIVHRDLKPDNVFLVDIKGDRPQVKLLDFGIAKLMGSQGLQRTQTGNMLGTPAYISPEQARAEGVDHRTDIYALGAMAFELLTGQLVFAATNAADMIAQHLYQPPRSSRALNLNVPPELDGLITRMLAKEAHARPTLEQVRDEMRAMRLLLGGVGVATPAQGVPMMPHGMQAPHTPPHGVYATPSPVQMTPSPMYSTPAPPMQMTPMQVPMYATPAPPMVMTPALAHMTPPPGAAPVAPMTQTAVTRRSRLPIILIALLLVGGGVTAVIVTTAGSPAKQAAPAQATPVEMPVAAPTPPKPDEAKPAGATPVEDSKASTVSQDPNPAESADTKAAETKAADTKAADTKAATTKPAETKKKSHSRTKPTTTGSGSATKPFDPDAPM